MGQTISSSFESYKCEDFNTTINNIEQKKKLTNIRLICGICLRDDQNLSYACSNLKCMEKCCLACLTQWYSTNQPGKIICTTAFLCPFCRSSPNIIDVECLQSVTKSRLKTAIESDQTWYYGWCLQCKDIVKHAKKECIQHTSDSAELESTTNFLCNNCCTMPIQVKRCPSCNTHTELEYGCKFVICKCRQFWCFECEKKLRYTKTYYTDHDMNACLKRVEKNRQKKQQHEYEMVVKLQKKQDKYAVKIAKQQKKLLAK